MGTYDCLSPFFVSSTQISCNLPAGSGARSSHIHPARLLEWPALLRFAFLSRDASLAASPLLVRSVHDCAALSVYAASICARKLLTDSLTRLRCVHVPLCAHRHAQPGAGDRERGLFAAERPDLRRLRHVSVASLCVTSLCHLGWFARVTACAFLRCAETAVLLASSLHPAVQICFASSVPSWCSPRPEVPEMVCTHSLFTLFSCCSRRAQAAVHGDLWLHRGRSRHR